MNATKEKPAAPTTTLRDRLWTGFTEAMLNGCWWCEDCQAITTKKESDQGLSSCCEKCGGLAIRWEKGIGA